MYINHRTQHTQANNSHRRFAKPSAVFNPEADSKPAAAMSDARLAAEAAFAAPTVHSEQPGQAQVTVRRTRTPFSAAEPTREETESGQSDEPALSRPRVFRVQALRTASFAGLHETVQRPPVAVHTRTATSGTVGAPRSPPHIATAQRPGPVTHMVLASPACRETEAAEPKLDTLIANLASVGQMLDAAQRAQSLEIVDPRAGALWMRLARRAEDIRKDIRALLR